MLLFSRMTNQRWRRWCRSVNPKTRLASRSKIKGTSGHLRVEGRNLMSWLLLKMTYQSSCQLRRPSLRKSLSDQVWQRLACLARKQPLEKIYSKTLSSIWARLRTCQRLSSQDHRLRSRHHTIRGVSRLHTIWGSTTGTLDTGNAEAKTHWTSIKWGSSKRFYPVHMILLLRVK